MLCLCECHLPAASTSSVEEWGGNSKRCAAQHSTALLNTQAQLTAMHTQAADMQVTRAHKKSHSHDLSGMEYKQHILLNRQLFKRSRAGSALSCMHKCKPSGVVRACVSQTHGCCAPAVACSSSLSLRNTPPLGCLARVVSTCCVRRYLKSKG